MQESRHAIHIAGPGLANLEASNDNAIAREVFCMTSGVA
jgi:hypothetical protein